MLTVARGAGKEARPGGVAVLWPDRLQPRTQQDGRCERPGCGPEPPGPVVVCAELQIAGTAAGTDAAAAPAEMPEMTA
jgi:hypothetical protein